MNEAPGMVTQAVLAPVAAPSGDIKSAVVQVVIDRPNVVESAPVIALPSTAAVDRGPVVSAVTAAPVETVAAKLTPEQAMAQHRLAVTADFLEGKDANRQQNRDVLVNTFVTYGQQLGIDAPSVARIVDGIKQNGKVEPKDQATVQSVVELLLKQQGLSLKNPELKAEARKMSSKERANAIIEWMDRLRTAYPNLTLAEAKQIATDAFTKEGTLLGKLLKVGALGSVAIFFLFILPGIQSMGSGGQQG